ncbi:hypothetical protein P9112_000939 [Eukaryota sp. TZLM1-RC]
MVSMSLHLKSDFSQREFYELETVHIAESTAFHQDNLGNELSKFVFQSKCPSKEVSLVLSMALRLITKEISVRSKAVADVKPQKSLVEEDDVVEAVSDIAELSRVINKIECE